MSTSSSTRSGITLIFVPARMMVGAMVVWVQAWAWRASPTRGSSSQNCVDPVGVEQGPGQIRREADPGDEPGPGLVQLGGGTVLVDAADHLGRLDQRVVRPEGLTAVARGAPDRQEAPEDALLAHDHRAGGGCRRPRPWGTRPDSVIT